MVNENDLAYDGSNRPQERELTARERDILCRVIAERIIDNARLMNSNIPEFLKNMDYTSVENENLKGIRQVIDPRES